MIRPVFYFAMLVVMLSPALGQAEEYVFSAAPRETAEKGAIVYNPVAEYLSKVTGKTIVYRHPDNWLNYQAKMQKGHYDLLFDGPHLIGWRMANVKHEPIARVPGKLTFVVFVRKDNKSINRLDDLAGHTMCGMAPPNFATLTMYSQFSNPARQPLLVETTSFQVAYKIITKGGCVAGVTRDKMFDKLQKQNGNQCRVIWRSKGAANQGFSAGPRFSSEDKDRIVKSLMAPEAQHYLQKFFERFNKKDKKLVVSTRQEYTGLGRYLKDVWGFQ